MLESLALRAGDRKCRLFACACCRRAWGLLSEASRDLVEAVERYADGLAPMREVEAAAASRAATDDTPDDEASRAAESIARPLLQPSEGGPGLGSLGGLGPG